MKSILSLILFMLFSHLSNAQVDKVYEYAGTLELSTKELITFKIQFKEIGEGKIEGNSLTDIYGDDRTKSTIKGNVNWENKKISFAEEANLDTKSKADPKTFCYIYASNLQIKSVQGKTIIQGSFSGKYLNGEKCVGGSIYLIETAYLKKIAKDYLPDAVINNSDSAMLALKETKAAKTTKKNNILKNKDVLNLKWTSDEIVIDVWDSKDIDGDEIALYVNGRKILDKFVMGPEKKTLVVPFTEKKGSIRIEALNEGKLKLCTANFTIRDGETSTEVVTILRKNENVVVVLTKK